MEEWKEYKLGEVAIPVRDRIDTSVLDASSYISTENMLPDKAGVTLSSGVPSGKAIQFKEGDILISNIRPYFKKIWRADKVGGCSADIICLRASKEVEPLFFYYLLSQDLFFNYVMQGAKGTKMPRGDRNQIMQWPVSLPSKSEQQKIATILSALDHKIEVNRRINDNLEKQAQALFKSWFVDYEPFRNLPFIDSEQGRIPEGWCATVLEDLCSFISRGLTPKYDESSNELILGQTCVRNNIVTLDNARKHTPKQRTDKWVKRWDTLINSTGVGSLGRVGIVYFDMDNVAIDSHITVVRPKSALVRHYVGRNLLNRQLEIENMAVGSTGQTELPKDRVKYLPIVLPDDNTLTRFNAIIEPIAYLLYRNIEDSRRIATLRDSLLPKLMSGELKVNDLMM
jgi:type I restriction enzyme S subunit